MPGIMTNGLALIWFSLFIYLFNYRGVSVENDEVLLRHNIDPNLFNVEVPLKVLFFLYLVSLLELTVSFYYAQTPLELVSILVTVFSQGYCISFCHYKFQRKYVNEIAQLTAVMIGSLLFLSVLIAFILA